MGLAHGIHAHDPQENETHDIAEFCITPVMRKKHRGFYFALAIFKKHIGKWKVRQIEGADGATGF